MAPLSPGEEKTWLHVNKELSNNSPQVHLCSGSNWGSRVFLLLLFFRWWKINQSRVVQSRSHLFVTFSSSPYFLQQERIEFALQRYNPKCTSIRYNKLNLIHLLWLFLFFFFFSPFYFLLFCWSQLLLSLIFSVLTTKRRRRSRRRRRRKSGLHGVQLKYM